MSQREQLNLRLPPDWFDVLTFAAAFDQITIAEYVKLIVSERVSQLREDPDIKVVQILSERRAREKQPDAKSGSVTQLRPTARSDKN
jgi:uncharacterized protein (DUF1778 family)